MSESVASPGARGAAADRRMEVIVSIERISPSMPWIVLFKQI
jgi:hypothetical protein